MAQFKVGDRVRWSSSALAAGMDGEHGKGPFTIQRVDSISAQFQEKPRYADGEPAWFNFGWLELAAPAPALVALDRVYKTRDGRAVRIYAVDGGGKFPVHGAYLDGDEWITERWTASGAYVETGEGGDDLIEVKPEYTRWMVCSADTGYDTQEEAREVADFAGAAVVPVTFRPGDGL